MDTIAIAQIATREGKEVELRGWLYNKRSSGKLHFLQVRDGTGIMQCVVFKDDVSPEVFVQCDHLGQESSLMLRGLVRKEPRSPAGFELSVREVQIFQAAEGYPISPKEHGIGFLMEQRHLWLRSSRPHAALKVRGEVLKACRDYMERGGFVLVDAPIFTPAACEGTTTLFETEYFEQKAYLTQSGQLYMEAAAMALGKVYCFGPAFRAEKSKTRRHLTEFWMIEPEMAFFSFEENMALQEQFVSYVVQRVLERRLPDLKLLERDISKLGTVKPPFPRLRYDDAVEMLRSTEAQAYFEEYERQHETKLQRPFEWGGDFGAADETYLTTKFDTPFFITHFPTAIKAFYMKPDPQRPEVVLGADMLAPEGYGEIIGGGQRIDDLDLLLKRLEEHHLPQEPFQWYIDLRRYGSVPHGGFGMGIERCVAWICGIEHVRETSPFPRTIYRIYP